VTDDLRDVLLLLGGSAALYAGLPLLYTWRRTSVTLLLLYVHTAAVLTLGGLLGSIFSVPLFDDVALRGGQIAYGGFMYAALVTVIVGRDVRVLRNVILLTVVVTLIKYVLFRLAQFALSSDAIDNPFGTSDAVFDQSVRVVVLGGALNLAELVLLLALLEWGKRVAPGWAMRSLYVVAFVGILVLDGALFPTLVLSSADGVLAGIVAGVQAKLILALVFAVPLAAFVVLNREDMQRFEAVPLRLSYLVTAPQSSLVSTIERQEEQIAQQQASLDLNTAQMGEVRATVQSLLDSASSMVLIAVDPQLRVTHFSAGACVTLGYEPQHVVGNEVQMLLDRAEVARQAAAVGRPDADLPELLDALASTGAAGSDWALRTLAGEQRMLSISASRIDTDHGAIGYVLAGEDVTDRLRATSALSEALEKEQQSLSRLQSADRLRNDLVFTVSHELSTPITSIAGYLEMLQESDDPLSQWQQDALARALRNTVRLRRLVDDLRLISQVDTGELAMDHQLDLRDVVESCRGQVEMSTSDRDLTLHWQSAAEPVLVRGDAATLREVVLRLAGNAVKFTPDGGCVSVAVERSEEGRLLTVSDNGIGIPEEEQRRIFGRFERGSDMQERAIQGVGLGLSIVGTVVRRHGGRVDIDSAPGRGTTLRVTLPAVD
jgi:signal transduction histidine kinase